MSKPLWFRVDKVQLILSGSHLIALKNPIATTNFNDIVQEWPHCLPNAPMDIKFWNAEAK